jgi:2-phospho-L-lactate guanylyltransferase
MRQGVWALVPVKRLGEAKARLAPLLSRPERRQLARAMAADVLDMLGAVQELAGTLVVTGDADVAALARRAGALVVGDPPASGTDAAVRHGLDLLQSAGAAGAVVVPSDIPYARAGEIRAVISRLAACPVVIVPARRDGGTNLLALALPSRIPTAYGTGSFARHVGAARSAGVAPVVLQLEGAGRDIDVPADLVPEAGRHPTTRTGRLLRRLLRAADCGPVRTPEEAIA